MNAMPMQSSKTSCASFCFQTLTNPIAYCIVLKISNGSNVSESGMRMDWIGLDCWMDGWMDGWMTWWNNVGTDGHAHDIV
jgi:hypothetical protein